jgi:hypothetical protein
MLAASEIVKVQSRRWPGFLARDAAAKANRGKVLPIF